MKSNLLAEGLKAGNMGLWRACAVVVGAGEADAVAFGGLG